MKNNSMPKGYYSVSPYFIVDETYKQAIDEGCEIVEPPKEREGNPDRRATFKDFSENLWSVGTQLVEENS